jgi:hypothetical protein
VSLTSISTGYEHLAIQRKEGRAGRRKRRGKKEEKTRKKDQK